MANFYNPNMNMYPYQNGYQNFNMQGGMPYQAYQPMTYSQPQPQVQNNLQTSTIPSLNGKIVESQDIVKGTEIPFNSYGIFPQADMQHIWIKSWNADGTTKITDYIPVINEQSEESKDKYSDTLNDIYNQIEKLGEKIDNIQFQFEVNDEPQVEPIRNNSQKVTLNRKKVMVNE